MTKEEILAMEAGERLNEEVAEGIMGACYHQHWKNGEDSIYCLKCGESRFYHQHSQAYSTDISAAWQVQEKMSQLAYDMSLLLHGTRTESALEIWLASDWYCDFRPRGEVFLPEYEWVDHQKTAPEAICKAALIAKRKEVT